MNLEIYNWKPFRVGKLFVMLNGKGITQEEIEENQGTFIAVQSGEDNNGVMGKIDLNYCKRNDYTFSEKPCLTVARSGTAGFVSFQKNGCVVGDSAKILLLADDIASTNVYLFLQMLLLANRFKYTYGRKVTQTKYLNDVIDLPVKRNTDNNIYIDHTHRFSEMGYVPDWQFMEDYINSLHCRPLTTANKPNQVPLLNIQQWKEFELTDIFIVKGGFYNKKPEHSFAGNIPFLASTESNNGVTEYYSLKDIEQWDKVGDEDWTLDKKIYSGNCIAVTVNGSVCNAFYQKEQFTCSHDITVLYLKQGNLTPHIAIFLCTIIMLEKYRWSYGRKPHDVKKFGKSIIKLPVTASGKPDWGFMENYIKSLPYGDRLE